MLSAAKHVRISFGSHNLYHEQHQAACAPEVTDAYMRHQHVQANVHFIRIDNGCHGSCVYYFHRAAADVFRHLTSVGAVDHFI